MPTSLEIQKSMIHRLVHEVKRAAEISAEMERLSDPYNRYQDLMKARQGSDARFKRISQLLSGVGITGTSEEVLRKWNEMKSAEAELPTWEAMAEYLCHVTEATIEEIQRFFVELPFREPSRQAIESALKTHRDIFRITKKGKDRLISLK
jgi:DNA repair ATPase RecN